MEDVAAAGDCTQNHYRAIMTPLAMFAIPAILLSAHHDL